MQTPQHIGIVACSAEGASLCYRTICIEGAQLLGPHGHPEVSMHTPSLAYYVARLERGDCRGAGELILRSADKLAKIGAGFLICPDNTIHQALPHVLPRSPLPWLHIAEVVADVAVQRGFSTWPHRNALAGRQRGLPSKLAARGCDYMCAPRPPARRHQSDHHG
ncbi:MAG: hypothetical protein R3D05_11230 [Dongiaceae bacterium]